MNRRNFIIGSSGMLSLAACAHVLGSDNPGSYQTIPISDAERMRILAEMKPPKRKRPVIAVLADNQGSETTDFIIPWSVLTRSGVADVYAVALEDKPIRLMPALTILPQLTINQFDNQFPDGADYVIVPAFHNSKSPKALAWIKQQHALKSSITGICAGALPLAHAGLLDGRRATTHWYSIKKLKHISPTSIWEKDRRFVADNGIITSTGVSASLPLSLTLVEAIAGKDLSDGLAKSLGVHSYDARHNSAYFKLRPNAIYRAATNSANIFGHEKIGLNISDGIDELSLAFAADAWSRTYRSKAYTISGTKIVKSLSGLEILTDFAKSANENFSLYASVPTTPGGALNSTLEQIEVRYGNSTANNVALQLEYPWQRT